MSSKRADGASELCPSGGKERSHEESERNDVREHVGGDFHWDDDPMSPRMHPFKYLAICPSVIRGPPWYPLRCSSIADDEACS
jgi:hypothetical protein